MSDGWDEDRRGREGVGEGEGEASRCAKEMDAEVNKAVAKNRDK